MGRRMQSHPWNEGFTWPSTLEEGNLSNLVSSTLAFSYSYPKGPILSLNSVDVCGVATSVKARTSSTTRRRQSILIYYAPNQK